MAYYALNLFDLKDPEGYREYIRRARPVNESASAARCWRSGG